MNNVIKTSSKGARQGGIGLKDILNEGIFTNVIYYSEFADGRKYVGQTRRGFLTRHKDHMRKDKENNHYNNILQKHMDEAVIYPICFGVEDIEDIDTVDLLNGLEVAEIMLRETFNDVDKEHGLNHTTGGYNHEKSQALKERYSKISTNTGIYNLFKKESKDASQGFRWIYKYSENGKSHEITSISLIEIKEKVLSNNLPWTILDEKKANEIFKKYGKSKDQLTWKFGIKNVSKVKMNNKQGFTWMYTTKVDGKRKQISAAKIHKLHEKIIKQGLPWEIIEEEKAKETMENNGIGYWDSEEGQKQKEKMSNERRVEINAENILNCIDKYMTINETAKELNTNPSKITNELRRQGYDKYSNLRNQAISEDIIKSKMTINEFATKHNIRINDIKSALTKTGKKYMIKSLTNKH